LGGRQGQLAERRQFRQGPAQVLSRPAGAAPADRRCGPSGGKFAKGCTDRAFTALATRSIVATSDFLGNKPYMMGDAPTGLDATAFAFVAGILCPVFESPTRLAAERHDNLKSYVERMMARFYPGFSQRTGHQTAA
jgi:glutathione S-transferase